MTNELIQALEAAALAATLGNWTPDDNFGFSIQCYRTGLDRLLATVNGPNAENDTRFIALASPKNIKRVLAEREADKALIAEQAKRIAEMEARTSNAWITHDGLSRPHSLGKNDHVYLKTRKQELNIPYPAGIAKGWFHSGGDMDIVAYRPAEARTLTVKLPEGEYRDDLVISINEEIAHLNRCIARYRKEEMASTTQEMEHRLLVQQIALAVLNAAADITLVVEE